MTLIEVMIAFALLSVALLGFVKVVVFSTSNTDTQRESTTAKEAARQAIEMLQAQDFREVFLLYNDDPNDDPGGPGTAPGSAIDVEGLLPVAGAVNGAVGRIIFPTEVGDMGDVELREDAFDNALGMPRDLNGDGAIDSVDHADDYQLLPVRIRFEWTGKGGRANLEVKTLLADY
jgi:type II secretory pathway pseudopilin PulG